MSGAGGMSGESGMSSQTPDRLITSARSQLNVLRYIAGHVEAHGYAPSFRKIAASLGRTGLSGVHRDVENLAEYGHIERLRKRACAIAVVTVPALPRAADGAPCHFIPADSIARRLERLHPRQTDPPR